MNLNIRTNAHNSSHISRTRVVVSGVAKPGFMGFPADASELTTPQRSSRTPRLREMRHRSVNTSRHDILGIYFPIVFRGTNCTDHMQQFRGVDPKK